ncbi:hypothetical protein [Sphingomonas sp. FARSPH]|uniref:hypothetical protein n=1 Tax=Sphingomonas sp. FARSPH TaxID=2219696 RepID=UPI000E103A3B|nr:hypothetical protein [Sphingomonas sp. FARSPH]AXJ97495.1 hypothetical protein DM480_17580 [Sphingomonas sp. FARSPH]
MARPIKARLFELELKAARLRTLRRKQINGERFVIGALMIEAARRDPVVRDLLLAEVEREPMRDMDRERIAPLIDELRELTGA